jgi:hypothetical protein
MPTPSLHILLPLVLPNATAASSTATQQCIPMPPPNATAKLPPSSKAKSTHVDCCVLIVIPQNARVY